MTEEKQPKKPFKVFGGRVLVLLLDDHEKEKGFFGGNKYLPKNGTDFLSERSFISNF